MRAHPIAQGAPTALVLVHGRTLTKALAGCKDTEVDA